MVELQRGERLQIMLNDDELKALDDWRFARRMPSRASAIRELLRRGLAAEGAEIARSGAKSKDYGVVGSASKTAARNGRAKPGA
jgi:metal-responsive CopG/Arc/MetJ family transcriptional regulator